VEFPKCTEISRWIYRNAPSNVVDVTDAKQTPFPTLVATAPHLCYSMFSPDPAGRPVGTSRES
jgi:hypothetical protein